MKKRMSQVVSVLAVSVFLFTSLIGCGQTKTSDPTVSVSTSTEVSTSTSTATATDDGKVKLPLTDKPVTFKVFYPLNRIEMDMTKNELWKKISQDTGVNFTWESPVAASGAQEAYNLMLASGNLPDMVIHSGSVTYKGGYGQAVDDGIYLDLKESLPKYAPNYYKQLSESGNSLRDALTDKGQLPGIYQIRTFPNDQYDNMMGLMLRGDWLKELNLPVPQTLDDWYTTLKAFKEKKKAAFPLLIGPGNGMESNFFMSAFGIGAPPISQNATHQLFYPDAQGKIHYGGVEQGFQEFLQLMSKWYAEGLFDRDFTTRGMRDLPGRVQLFVSGQAGVVAVYPEWTGMFFGASKDKNMTMVATPYPAKVAGEKQNIIVTRTKNLDQPVCITTACKQPELLLSFFNYLSTPEGTNMMNYGTEGSDWTMTNGQPTFTDKIMKNELGVASSAEVFTGGIRPIHLGSSENFSKQANPPANIEAKKIFSNSSDPYFTAFQLNGEEGAKLTSIMGDIVTYTAEQSSKAIMDPNVAAKWMDVNAKQIKSMNVDEAIAVVQVAYDRYLARK